MKKPYFTVDQLNSASYAAKRFGEIRKKAKENPQFISDNNKMDTVILNYNQYENMYNELETLRETVMKYEVERRIDKVTANPKSSITLPELMEEDEYRKYRSIDADSISDEDLFENE